jgi:heptosyltransferase I
MLSSIRACGCGVPGGGESMRAPGPPPRGPGLPRRRPQRYLRARSGPPPARGAHPHTAAVPLVPLPTSARVAIVMMSAVGDAVHVLPVVTALKRHDPTLRITWILQPGPASLVRGHPDVDEIVLFDRRRGLRAFLDLRRRLAGPPFDVLLALQVYLKAGVVGALVPARVRLGFDRRRARDLNWIFTNRRIAAGPHRHVQDQYFEFLIALGVDPEPVEWKLGPWEHERAAQRAFFSGLDRPAATLVIASSKPQRAWSTERWARVADALYEHHGLQPVLAGGRSPAELAMEREIRERARHPLVSTLGCPLRELVQLLDGSALAVSVDTGPMHIAAALAVPTISLHGPWNPKRTGPYRRFEDLRVDAYGDPGEDYPVSPRKRPGRMARITVEDVLRRVDVWRERYAADRIAQLERAGLLGGGSGAP